ncbi:rod shape-determining protein RodA [Amylibacter sp.]|jgi:rod shape determining protein RodA|nr:rod shape-determining protein RodA [Amylibacter sp.]MDB4188460.1 rod shape-determining protein RodA [bacterium]MDA9074149.1 rod shape-determining protein RodA [Amylibacter sp.]MDA9293876.1 rod shape-determining protein RodA [Amylibacter sp.]MDA9313482.1 rod shape-determining protein RodA [Amylibacter sp.]|tara:strand:+ start:1466 stop:2605 length:1140 start_codon:yes stop_codon:yes gene_type:complete
MSFITEEYKGIPTGFRKILYFHWPLALLLIAVSCIGFLMLFSVSGGNFSKWSEPQIIRFCVGFIAMIMISFTPISVWRSMSIYAYLISLILLFYVEYFGITGKGAQRWIDLGFIRLQPSEFMKIALVMVLALYYDWLDDQKVSKIRWLIPPILLTTIPMVLVLNQPDLGTAILLASGAAVVMLLAGVSLWYFMAGISSIVGLVYAVILSKGTDFQILKNYQYQRIETFLDPSSDPLGTGYHITQSKIALGSGGYSGRGFMQGTQSQLNFLPEKHTDFIFTTFAEEFGFLGGIILLFLYILIIFCCYLTAMQNHNRFAALLTLGIAATFFFYFSVNMLMVMGLAPVVGVPLPLISYGGSAMLVLLGAFGLVQSAHIHRTR